MFEFRCPACEALAYSSVQTPHTGGCPSCGVADLEEIKVAEKAQTAPRRAPLAPMNFSVAAVRAAEGLRAPRLKVRSLRAPST